MTVAYPRPTSLARKSCDFWPWTTPANVQYCRSRNTPACTSTRTRNRAWRSVNPKAATALTRSGRALSLRSRRLNELIEIHPPRADRTGAPPPAVTTEPGPHATAGVGTAVVLREDLDILVSGVPVQLVFDAEIREMD